MRKNYKRLISIVAVLAMITLLVAACQQDTPAAPAPAPEAPAAPAPEAPAAEAPAAEAPATGGTGKYLKDNYLVIGIPKVVHPWYDDVVIGAERAVAELAEMGITVEFEWSAPPEADVILHTQRLETAAARNPDGIFVSSLDSAANTTTINEIVASGIPVVTYDSDAAESNRYTFIGNADDEADGARAAEALADLMGEEGEVAFLVGSLGAPNHIGRIQGARDKLAEFPGISIVADPSDNDDMQRAMELTEDILRANPNVRGFYSPNAGSNVAIPTVVLEMGKEDEIFIVGHDDLPECLQFIHDGIVDISFVEYVQEMGYWSVMYLLELADGREVPDYHEVGSFKVTRETIGDFYPEFR